MKKLALILLVLQGCTEPDLPQTFLGEWSISWQIDEYNRVGHLYLNDDQTGTISIEKDTEAFILPQKEQIEVAWRYDEPFLKLTRLDNNMVLNYTVLNKTNKQISMLFANDILVVLSK